MNKKLNGTIDMLVCSLLWSTAGVLLRFVTWNSSAIVCLRSLFAWIPIQLFLLKRKDEFIVNKKVIISAICMAITSFLFIEANKLTTVANAVVLQYIEPVFIILINFLFYKKQMKKFDIVTVLLTMCGVVLSFVDQLSPGYFLGNLLAMLSGLTMAIMFVLCGDMQINERTTSISLGNIISFVVGLPFIFKVDVVFDFKNLIFIAIIGLITQGISYVFFIKSMETCPPLTCSMLSALNTVLAPVWTFIILDERPGEFALIGGIIVILIVSVWCFVSNKQSEE